MQAPCVVPIPALAYTASSALSFANLLPPPLLPFPNLSSASVGVRRRAAEVSVPVPASRKREAAEGAEGEKKKAKRKRKQRLPKGCVASAPGPSLRRLPCALSSEACCCRGHRGMPWHVPSYPNKRPWLCFRRRFDPAKPGPLPDPERWLPKWQRADAKKLRKRRKDKVGGLGEGIPG